MTQSFRKSLNNKLQHYDYACRQVKSEQQALITLQNKLTYTEEAQKIIQGIAETVQQQAHKQIALIVTRCLKAVFGENAYELQIHFEQKRGKTEASLLFVRDGMEVEPLSSAGGGVIDVAAFALRLACLILSRPAKRRLLVLDEPWKHLSRQYQPMVKQLLELLAKEMEVQIILVTHSDLLQTGKVIEL